MSGGPKTPAALINLCAFPAAPQGKRYEMVNHTRSWSALARKEWEGKPDKLKYFSPNPRAGD
jgi:hypothetical protein